MIQNLNVNQTEEYFQKQKSEILAEYLSTLNLKNKQDFTREIEFFNQTIEYKIKENIQY